MARLSIISAILTLFALTVTPVHAQHNSATLAELIKQMAPYSQDFQLKKDQPSGAAWTGLLEKIQAADGLIIGEDHGIHEIPVLVEAMMPTLVQHGYRHYVMEVDPFTAALMERLAATGHSQAVERQLKNYPYSLPFLTNREEFALFANFL